MTEEQLDILKKALSLYKFSISMRNDDMERIEFGKMLEELSSFISYDVTYWSLYD